MMLPLAIVLTVTCVLLVVGLVAHWADANAVEPSWPAAGIVLAFTAGMLLAYAVGQREREQLAEPVSSEILPRVPVKPLTAERP